MFEHIKRLFGKFRITSIDTPIGGVSWEYKDKDASDVEEDIVTAKVRGTLNPDFKLKVFVSSICGDGGKYDTIRINLKKSIEETGIADVYLFEATGASTVTAGKHYLWSLEDSDVCIFFIDNKDGVTSGVQKEIDKAQKNKIKSFYYFCDEHSKDKTALEISLMGAQFAKSKTVHTFGELEDNGFKDLLNDILFVYHHYCKGRLGNVDEEQEWREYSISENIVEFPKQVPVRKSIINKNDLTKAYILHWVVGIKSDGNRDKGTNSLDEWSCQFLKVLFEGKSVKEINLDLMLADLAQLHQEQFMEIVRIRWQAIQSYFLNDIDGCINSLEVALRMAKDSGQPDWVLKDVLIDLRNMQLVKGEMTNNFLITPAQKELTDSDEEVYYPVMDRLREDLDEKYLKQIFEKKIESPNVIKFGSLVEQFASTLGSIFMIAVYNGSLTHILLFYEQIQNFLQYLIDNYDDWNYRLKLLALTILDGKSNVVEKMTSSDQTLLNNITSEEASFIMRFCEILPLSYRRFKSRLIAFGTVGYFLNDEEYQKYETNILLEIENWLNDKSKVSNCGNDIFNCLSGVRYRMSQNTIVDICCKILEEHLAWWYFELFKFMRLNVDISEADINKSTHLINLIIDVLNNDKEREQVSHAPDFLWTFRRQSKEITEPLDKKVKEALPNYYEKIYHLETAYDAENDSEEVAHSCIDAINIRNKTQGENGVYQGFVTREIATIRNLIVQENAELSNETIDSLIASVKDTLMLSKESLSVKVDAVSLLISIKLKYPVAYERNSCAYEELFENRFIFENGGQSLFLSNIDKVALKISLCVLFTLMNHDVYSEFIECMSLIYSSEATILEVSRFFYEYYEADDKGSLSDKIETVLLQAVLQWKQMGNLDICIYVTRLLFSLLRNQDNQNLINQMLIRMIDEDSLYVKNIILRQIFINEGITKQTRDYIVSKCQTDENYVVRMVCNEVLKSYNTEDLIGKG